MLLASNGMKVLSVDPGYGRCGMAVLEKKGGKEALLYSVCVETSPKAPFPERLLQVADECVRLLIEYAPDAVAMEKLHFGTNQKTGLQVAEVRGALIAEAARAEVPLFEYMPGEVKSAVSGFGGANKTQMTKMLHLLLSIK